MKYQQVFLTRNVGYFRRRILTEQYIITSFGCVSKNMYVIFEQIWSNGTNDVLFYTYEWILKNPNMDKLLLVLNMQDAIISCIADNVNLWNNMTPEESITEDLFFNNFKTRMDKHYKEFNSELKVY